MNKKRAIVVFIVATILLASALEFGMAKVITVILKNTVENQRGMMLMSLLQIAGLINAGFVLISLFFGIRIFAPNDL
jgi:cbb3-type cytochrome oxidase cytochrome c subunit